MVVTELYLDPQPCQFLTLRKIWNFLSVRPENKGLQLSGDSDDSLLNFSTKQEVSHGHVSFRCQMDQLSSLKFNFLADLMINHIHIVRIMRQIDQ